MVANPFAFRPAQVTFWTTLVYIALLAPLVWIHETVPPPPSESALPNPISLIEAWDDLGALSDTYHPLNSRANDVVRDWVLLRTQEILDEVGVPWTSDPVVSGSEGAADAEVVVFNDMVANVTYQDKVDTTTINRNANYFEGSNVYVYIRGTEDERGEWWKGAKAEEALASRMKKKGVLVNAHIDSVSTGFGATDNGVAVVSCLQLVKYFATPANRPRRGLVILFNNGEEDGLYGAHVFGNSPLNPFIGSFVNLDGAGAGGRATLFRSTDLEVTRAYASSPHPFGSVVGTDGYKAGWIRSDTDYHTFVDAFGYRGLDIAFYSPRALYHTAQDDRKHTSKASVWHMLSSALASTRELAGDGAEEVGSAMNNGVWFDLFGDSMVLFYLGGMFAWSLTVLIATPLVLILLLYVVHKFDKDFIGKYSIRIDHHSPESEKVPAGGMRGFFRFPFALVIAGALTFGAALLLRKVQPFIVYSSPYAVWAMMLSLFYFSFWCLMKGADFARPSALHRAFVHLWLFAISWVLLVAVTVLEDRLQIASGYVFVFWASQMFLSTLLCIFEFFGLPKKSDYARELQEQNDFNDHLHEVPHNEGLLAPDADEQGDSAGQDDEDDEDDEDPVGPNERTPLVGGDRSSDNTRRTTFASGYRRSVAAIVKASRDDNPSHAHMDGPATYKDEQPWSASLPSTLWFFEFLLIGPFMIVLTSQLALLLTTALSQTGADGSDLLRPYLFISLFGILLLLPLTPFIHRVSHHVPLFLLAVFAGTLIYNLLSFPFSPKSPYKVYFRQEIDLDGVSNRVIYTGVEEYVRQIVAEMPSAHGQDIECVPASDRRPRGLVDCSFDGSKVAPDVGGNVPPGIPPEKGYQGLVKINIKRPDDGKNKTMNSGKKDRNTARFTIDAINSRTCTLSFAKPVADVRVKGGNGWDERFSGSAPDDGFYGVKNFDLWRRDWTTPWVVDVEWEDGEDSASVSNSRTSIEWNGGKDELRRRAKGLDGNVTCKWSDANTPGVIPALDEAVKYLPTWALVSKARVGLVEGRKSWLV